MTELPKVIMAAPVRNRAWILPEYLACLDALDYPQDRLGFLFIENNSLDNSWAILSEFARSHSVRLCRVLFDVSVESEGVGQARTRSKLVYWQLAALRNFIIDLFLSTGADALFSVDTDILVPPHALRKLVENDKDICSALVSNLPNGGPVYNIMDWWEEKQRFRHRRILPEEEVFQVGMTGACYLIKREVLEAGVRYGFSEQGEDIPFCQLAQARGFTIWCDQSIRPEHIMVRGKKGERQCHT